MVRRLLVWLYLPPGYGALRPRIAISSGVTFLSIFSIKRRTERAPDISPGLHTMARDKGDFSTLEKYCRYPIDWMIAVAISVIR